MRSHHAYDGGPSIMAPSAADGSHAFLPDVGLRLLADAPVNVGTGVDAARGPDLRQHRIDDLGNSCPFCFESIAAPTTTVSAAALEQLCQLGVSEHGKPCLSRQVQSASCEGDVSVRL